LLFGVGCSDEPNVGPTSFGSAGSLAGTSPAAAGTATGGAATGGAGASSGGSSTAGALAGLGGGLGGDAGPGGAAGLGGTAGVGGDSFAGAGTVGGVAGGGGLGGVGGAGGYGGGGGSGGLAAGVQTVRPIGNPFAKNGYWEYLPPGYGDGAKRPLLVFWAGVGENGDGSANALSVIVQRHGPPMLIAKKKWPSDRPFIVLSPQHTAAVDRPSPEEVRDFLTFAIGKYDVDPTRVYLTALSSGSRGSWSYLGQYKGEQVAAAALIAGDSSVAYAAGGCSVVQQVALWTFHGDADSEVPYADDKAGMTSFIACAQPRKEAIFTTYPGIGHQDSWTRTYDLSAGHDIYSWLLSKSR
jgi:poly(3-hydroxybutyrate) depolymerase